LRVKNNFDATSRNRASRSASFSCIWKTPVVARQLSA
jgi:hypothetical protein